MDTWKEQAKRLVDDFVLQVEKLSEELGEGKEGVDSRLIIKSLQNIEEIMNQTLFEFNKRKNYLHSITEKNASCLMQLCQEMGEDFSQFAPDQTHNLMQLNNSLVDQIKKLESIKMENDKKKFLVLREEFKILLNLTRKFDLDENERLINDLDPFVATSFPVSQTRESIKKLRQLKDINRSECLIIKEKIKKLLIFLGKGEDEVPSVFTNKVGGDDFFCRSDFLHDMKIKLSFYENQKEKLISGTITKLKEEIKEIWEKYRFSDLWKLESRVFFSTEVSEAQVVELEKYLSKCKNIASEIEFLNKNLEKFDDYWKELEQVEVRLHDKNKFLNRGGSLLKDEHLKKKILLHLPKLETDIKKALITLERENGYKQFEDSLSFSNKCAARWQDYHKKYSQLKGTKKSGGFKGNKKNTGKTTDDMNKKNKPNPSTHVLYAIPQDSSSISQYSEISNSHSNFQSSTPIQESQLDISAYSDGAADYNSNDTNSTQASHT